VRWLLALWMMTILSLAASGCNRPDIESCRQLCWHYYELDFWEKFEAETADMSPAEKATARAEREEMFNEVKNREHDPGRDNCVDQCRRDGKKSDVACVMAAKTVAEAKACKLDER
jgi:hypothetical protein